MNEEEKWSFIKNLFYLFYILFCYLENYSGEIHSIQERNVRLFD